MRLALAFSVHYLMKVNGAIMLVVTFSVSIYNSIIRFVLHGVVKKADFALPLEHMSVFKICCDLAQMLFCLELPDYLFY